MKQSTGQKYEYVACLKDREQLTKQAPKAGGCASSINSDLADRAS